MASIVLDNYMQPKGKTRVITKKNMFQAAVSILYGAGIGFDLDAYRQFKETDFEKYWRVVTKDKKGKKNIQVINED